jgi:hypothetical protein
MANVNEFAHYDPDSGIVSMLGKTVSIPDLVAEAQRIEPVALQAVYGTNGPMPSTPPAL